MDLTVNNVISLFPETKKQQEIFVEKMIESALSGDVDILKLETQIANIQAALKNYRDDERIKEMLLKEAEKYGKNFDLYNAKFEIKQVGVKYDFSECNHPKLAELSDKEKEIKEGKKEIETYLKALKTKQIIVDEETGDVIEIHPPSKSGSTQVVITIK